MATRSSAPPAWQRSAIFRFFASLKLAVILLAVLIIASIAGTIYESSFDAKVARAYVYGAPWFNLWLILLAANLAVSAFSRWPWRKHHVAFLITHLGIITLLTGSLIGRVSGIEGTLTLFKGEAPTSHLLIDERQLRVLDSDGIMKAFRAEFLHRPPTLQRRHDLATLANGTKLSVVGYADAMDAKLNPRPVPNGGAPALHFIVSTSMMGQRLESWLLADEQVQHTSYSLGLANVEIKRGRAEGAPVGDRPQDSQSRPSVTGETDLEESIFIFSKAPEQQISHATKGGSTGAKLSLSQPQDGDKGQLAISVAGKQVTVDVAQNIGKDFTVAGTPFIGRIENYWADFRIENGKPTSLSDAPNNPAVVVTIRGRATPGLSPAGHGNERNLSTNGGGAPVMNETNGAQNHLTLYVANNGAISYELKSRKLGDSSGPLELNRPLATGWADWQIVVDRLLPQAEQWMDFTPAKKESVGAQLPDGVRVRVEQNGESFDQWVPAGWQVTVPTVPKPIGIAYGWRSVPLPIGLELLGFEVARNEGNDAPAGFKSTLRVSTANGESAIGQCSMNRPFSFPGAWWRTWSGLTFKISQASWNPENLEQSTVQILRDPGWSLKWIGSLFVVAGVFMMFYVKKFRRDSTIPPANNIELRSRPTRTREPLVRV